MRIGELAGRIGVSTDTVRFYERSGWLPRAARAENSYREYSAADVEHLRLLIDLRRLDLPLDDAARIATWCHSGHCSDTRTALPSLIAMRRAEVADRITGLAELDGRLADLERHLAAAPARRNPLPMLADLGGAPDASPCCDAAGAVLGSAEDSCACCPPAASVP
ncbi:MAG TPA: MerR family transcriptional regulator [Candidatus Limnocylindria bacterium]|nr:MerR family transcriptional regulator [Candidatus Limnocylindria bacterium]